MTDQVYCLAFAGGYRVNGINGARDRVEPFLPEISEGAEYVTLYPSYGEYIRAAAASDIAKAKAEKAQPK